MNHLLTWKGADFLLVEKAALSVLCVFLFCCFTSNGAFSYLIPIFFFRRCIHLYILSAASLFLFDKVQNVWGLQKAK